MPIASAYTSERMDTLVAQFEELARSQVGPGYCRVRRNEFVLQRMLLPDIFDHTYGRALDVGCGIGFKSLLLGDIAREVDGIDLAVPYHGFRGHAPAAVVGQTLLDRVGCTWATLSPVDDLDRFLEGRPEHYDLIVTDYLVEHIADVALLHAAILRALQPGGVVVHAVPNTHDAIEQFVRLNVGASVRDIAKSLVGVLRRRRRAQKMTARGVLVPIAHSEFLSDFGSQFDVYRLERNVFPMIEAGFEIVRIVPTREHCYTVVGRRPAGAGR